MAIATLNHFDGSGTTFTDAVPGYTWAASGVSATQSTSSPIMGVASLLLDSTGRSSVRSTTAALMTAMNLGTASWRMDARVQSLDSSAPPDFYTCLIGTNIWGLRLRNFGTEIEFEGVNPPGFGGTLYDGGPHLVTVSWDSGTGRLYAFVDGTLLNAGGTVYGSSFGAPSAVAIGNEVDDSGGWHRQMDEVRVQTGVSVTASFTDPLTPWPDPPGSTYDRAETSVGTTAQERSIAVGTARAESSAGTEAQDRTISLSTAKAETSAGTEAQDRVISVARAAAESSAGTEAQDRTVALSRDAAETSAGTTIQDNTLAATLGVAESSAGTTAQDRTVAFTAGNVGESSAGTTAQDFTAGAIYDVGEASAPSTTQDRTVAFTVGNVAESSVGTTTQNHDVPPPASLGQSAMRRWLIQQYTQEFEAREKVRKIAEEAPPEPKLDNRRRVLHLKKVSEPDYEDRLSKAISLAQSLMLDHGADTAKVMAIIDQTTRTKALVSLASSTLAEAEATEIQPSWRKLGQAGWDEDDILLLAHIL